MKNVGNSILGAWLKGIFRSTKKRKNKHKQILKLKLRCTKCGIRWLRNNYRKRSTLLGSHADKTKVSCIVGVRSKKVRTRRL